MNQFMILIDGPMGSGKTTIGKILHKKLKRTALLSMDSVKWCVSDFRRNKEDNAMTAKVVRKMTEEYIKHGMSIIIPQAFWKKENIDPYIKLAKANNVNFFIYQLVAPKQILLDRLSVRAKPIEAKKPISQAKINRNFKMWKENQYGLGKSFDTSIVSAEKISQAILKDIKLS